VTGKLVLYLEAFLHYSSANRMIQSFSTHMNTTPLLRGPYSQTFKEVSFACEFLPARVIEYIS